jgi:hypothetical protein
MSPAASLKPVAVLSFVVGHLAFVLTAGEGVDVEVTLAVAGEKQLPPQGFEAEHGIRVVQDPHVALDPGYDLGRGRHDLEKIRG